MATFDYMQVVVWLQATKFGTVIRLGMGSFLAVDCHAYLGLVA